MAAQSVHEGFTPCDIGLLYLAGRHGVKNIVNQYTTILAANA
jgi:hypothetical protein